MTATRQHLTVLTGAGCRVDSVRVCFAVGSTGAESTIEVRFRPTPVPRTVCEQIPRATAAVVGEGRSL